MYSRDVLKKDQILFNKKSNKQRGRPTFWNIIEQIFIQAQINTHQNLHQKIIQKKYENDKQSEYCGVGEKKDMLKTEMPFQFLN